MTKSQMPHDFRPYVLTPLVEDDALRCDDCGGYTAIATVIGIQGRFCSCPFDGAHA